MKNNAPRPKLELSNKRPISAALRINPDNKLKKKDFGPLISITKFQIKNEQVPENTEKQFENTANKNSNLLYPFIAVPQYRLAQPTGSKEDISTKFWLHNNETNPSLVTNSFGAGASSNR